MDDQRDERDDTAESALIQAFGHFVRAAKSGDPSVEALPEPLLSIADAARYLNVSTTTVRNLAVGARVRSTRVGDRIRFRRVWLDEWIDAGGGEVPPPLPVSPRPEAEAPKAQPVARQFRRRPERKPKPPTCIQKVGDQELRLLADKSGDRFGRVYTWHVGLRTPICGAVGHWTQSLERWPKATYCPSCLTTLGAFPEADLALFGIGRVYMMRTTTRGTTPTPLRAGYHDGNGRRTICGKDGRPLGTDRARAEGQTVLRLRPPDPMEQPEPESRPPRSSADHPTTSPGGYRAARPPID
jgi:excisionase family DNA binding protein